MFKRRPHHPPTLPSLDAYARWAATYPPEAHNALMRLEQASMLALMPPLAGKRVLDLAGGSGRYGRIAMQAGAATAISIDNSLPMLDVNPLALRAAGALDAVPFRLGAFDIVICALAIGHSAQIDRPMAEIARMLAPGGSALISDFHPYAFLKGGQRTFTAPDGRTYAVEHHTHLASDVYRAARQAGLVLDALEEPRLGAGTATALEGSPVIIVYRLCSG